MHIAPSPQRRRHRTRWVLTPWLAALLASPFAGAEGPVVSTTGCPLFHCTPEATGVMLEPLVQRPSTVLGNRSLGSLDNQGCSGDGTRLACLFSTDAVASGPTKGTLKIVDPTTLQPVWGSAGVANSYDIDAKGMLGQVPVIFADGRVSAGDASRYVLYRSTGEVDQQITLNGKGKNMGMTPISAQYGVVSQSNGTLTLLDRVQWKKVSEITLRTDGAAVTLVSPSSGSSNVLYAVAQGQRNHTGYLFALAVQPDAAGVAQLVVRATFAFQGRSGASVVVVKPSVTNLPGNLVLLHVPGLVSDGNAPQNRLMGLLDGGGAFAPAWPSPILLPDALKFSPAIDDASRSLFFQLASGSMVYRHDLLSGLPQGQYDLKVVGSFPKGFGLNGHLPSNQSGGAFTLLLSGAYKSRATGGAQFVFGFQPIVAPGALLWSQKILDQPDSITEAWAIGPSPSAGIYCPIVIGSTSGITRVCD